MLNANDNAPDIMNCDTTNSSEEPNWEETWAALETGSTQVLTKNLSLSTQVAIQAFWYWFKRFNGVVLSKRHQRPDIDALKLLELAQIKLYIYFRVRVARTTKKGGRLHQSTVQGFYKTLQMVYFKYTQMQLPRATNDAVNTKNVWPSANRTLVITLASY